VVPMRKMKAGRMEVPNPNHEFLFDGGVMIGDMIFRVVPQNNYNRCVNLEDICLGDCPCIFLK
jgi:hypothetical protein